jgi:NitT/TauT family transport system ATP-binding protein
VSTVVFDRVWKEYGDAIVLEDISIAVAPCSFVAIVGPSGCGKTTLLRMALGDEQPTRGQILIDGKPLRPEPDADRGVVFQRYSVFPHLTALANVMIGCEFEGSPLIGRLFGAARRRAGDEAHALLEAVGLKGHEDNIRLSSPAACSSGSRSRKPSCAGRRSCFSTNRSARSTPASGPTSTR